MPNQMDDATIIRALRVCGETGKCYECPVFDEDEGRCEDKMRLAAADRLEAMAKELRDADNDKHNLFMDLCGANARADEYETDRDAWKARAEAAERDAAAKQAFIDILTSGIEELQNPRTASCADSAYVVWPSVVVGVASSAPADESAPAQKTCRNCRGFDGCATRREINPTGAETIDCPIWRGPCAEGGENATQN